MILSDWEILDLIDEGMIKPAERRLVGRAEGVLSYGLSPYGYDVRLGNEFVRYRDGDKPLDPCRITEDDVERFIADEFVIGPGEFLLNTSMEYFCMPRDVTAFPKDKSTYARLGITVQNTVVDAGFKGQVTLELNNQLRRPVILRAGQGISQFIFLRGNPCETSYSDRMGKYNGQIGTTLPRA